MTLEKQLIKTNAYASILLVIIFLIGLRSSHIAIVLLGTIITSIHMFFLSGANIMYLVQKLQKRTLSIPLYIALSILASLFFVPAILLGVYTVFGYINQWIPLFFYVSITLIPLLWKKAVQYFSRIIVDVPTQELPLAFPYRTILLHPVTVGLLLVFAVHIFNVTRYPFLAVLDPYSWLIKFEEVISARNLYVIDDGDRTLYTVFITAFHYLSSASFYAISKYVFPFLSLLTIPPLYLAGRTLRRPLLYIFLGAALTSPVIIFEFEIVRQQLMALLYMYFVVGLCAAYAATKDRLIMYAIGISALVGSLYHPLFLMVVIPWILCMGILYRKILWNHKIQGLIFLFLLIPWVEKLGLGRIVESIRFLGNKLIARFIQGNQNWQFPAQYVNIDQNPVGWAGATGVMKYYAFYAGALSLAIILAYIVGVLASSKFRAFITKNIRTIGSIIPLLLIVFFFIIAEVAPRTSNVAYLPDRAWQILGVILLFPLLGLLKYIDQFAFPYFRRGIMIVLAASIAINIFGAGYVSYLGRFTTPEYEEQAAQWIINNLPKNRIIFSASSKNLLRFHTQSNRIHIEPEYFATADSNLIVKHLVTLLNFQLNPDKPVNSLNISAKATEGTEKSTSDNAASSNTSYDNVSICDPGYLSYIQQKVALECSTSIAPSKNDTDIAIKEQKIPKEYASTPIYLYYAHTHPRNPYISRPYKSSFTGDRQESEFPGIDKNPEIFEKVYSDNENVFIWKVHLDKAGIRTE